MSRQDQHGLLGADGDTERGSGQVQAVVPPWGDRGKGVLGPQERDRAGEPQGVWGEGQADEQGCSPSGLAQGNLQGQEDALPSLVESAVPGWAVNPPSPPGSVFRTFRAHAVARARGSLGGTRGLHSPSSILA